jgi:hypothetical protein
MPSGAPTTPSHTTREHHTDRMAPGYAAPPGRDLGAASTGSEIRLRLRPHQVTPQHRKPKAAPQGSTRTATAPRRSTTGSTIRGGDTTMHNPPTPAPAPALPPAPAPARRHREHHRDRALTPATAHTLPRAGGASSTRTADTRTPRAQRTRKERRHHHNASAQASNAAIAASASGRVAGAAPGTASMAAAHPPPTTDRRSPIADRRSPRPFPASNPRPGIPPRPPAHLILAAARTPPEHRPCSQQRTPGRCSPQRRRLLAAQPKCGRAAWSALIRDVPSVSRRMMSHRYPENAEKQEDRHRAGTQWCGAGRDSLEGQQSQSPSPHHIDSDGGQRVEAGPLTDDSGRVPRSPLPSPRLVRDRLIPNAASSPWAIRVRPGGPAAALAGRPGVHR